MVRANGGCAGFRGTRSRGLLNVCAVAALMSTLLFVTGCPVVCESDAECDAATPFCLNPGPASRCVECLTDADCPDDGVCVENACVECTEDADCDDGDECTTDACTDATCSNTDFECAEGEVCDPATGCVAVECSADEDCVDGTFCEPEVCVNSLCEDGADPCPDQICVEADGACVDCLIDEDCEDDEFCADDGTCQLAPTGCETDEDCTDDALSVCDTESGECVECVGDEDCGAGEVCTENACEEAPPCDVDADDCDDGLFCNGTETCDPDSADADARGCVAGTDDPCADVTCEGNADPICSEGDTAADCTCPPVETIEFTLDADNLIGTTGDDVFFGPLSFNPGTGAQIATLQTGDSANGLAGNDTLNASFNNDTGRMVTPTLITGIEIFNITDFGGALTTLNGVNISGATAFNSVNSASTNAPAITNLPNIVDIGMTNTDSGFDIGFASAATSGSADSANITLSQVNGGTLTLRSSGTNGFESATITSNGDTANTLPNLTQANGTTLATLNFSGAQNLEMRRTDTTVLTFGGTGMSGNLTLGSGDGSNSEPYSAFHSSNVNIKSFTGGSGDDMIIFGATFNGNDASGTSETIDGGDGDDGLQATLSATIGGVMPIANMEKLFLNATATSQLNLTGVAGLNAAWIDGANGATTETLTLLNISGATALPSLNYRGDNRQLAQSYDAVTYQAAGAGGSSDTLSVTVGNRGTALNSSGTTNGHTLGLLTIPQVEVLNFTCNDGPCTVTTGITATTLTTLTCTGSSNVTVNDIETLGGSDTVLTINAGGVTGDFSGNCDDLASGASLTFGSGSDSFTTNDSAHTSSVVTCGAGNDTYVSEDDDSDDVINGGAGTDTITGGGGLDTITGGTDADTFIFNADNADATDADTISDFTTGASADVISMDVSGVGGGIIANLSSANFANGTAAAVAAANDTIIVINDTSYATFTLAEAVIQGLNAATTDYLLVFLNSTSGVVEVHADADSSAADGNVLLASLSNITVQTDLTAFVAANFNTF